MLTFLVKSMGLRLCNTSNKAAEYRIGLLGNPLEILFAECRPGPAIGPYSIDSMGEEKISVRIDKPPLAANLFGAEETSRLQTRAMRPSAESITTGNGTSRVPSQPPLFVRARFCEILLAFYLSRPVVMAELPETVYEREKIRCMQSLAWLGAV